MTKLDMRQRKEAIAITELASDEDALYEAIAALIVERDEAKEYEWMYKELQK